MIPDSLKPDPREGNPLCICGHPKLLHADKVWNPPDASGASPITRHDGDCWMSLTRTRNCACRDFRESHAS